MNERIKELVEKSFIYDRQNDSSFFDKEKFARLIVIKCLDIVDKKVSGMVGVAAMKEIEEYFEVEA